MASSKAKAVSARQIQQKLERGVKLHTQGTALISEASRELAVMGAGQGAPATTAKTGAQTRPKRARKPTPRTAASK